MWYYSDRGSFVRTKSALSKTGRFRSKLENVGVGGIVFSSNSSLTKGHFGKRSSQKETLSVCKRAFNHHPEIPGNAEIAEIRFRRPFQ